MSRNFTKIVARSLFVVLTGIGVAWSADLWVPSAAYPTIQKAIDAANAGDRVRVSASTIITENFNVNKNITIMGSSSTYKPTIRPLSSEGIRIFPNMVTINNIEFEITTKGHIIRVDQGANVSFNSCEFWGYQSLKFCIIDYGAAGLNIYQCFFAMCYQAINAYSPFIQSSGSYYESQGANISTYATGYVHKLPYYVGVNTQGDQFKGGVGINVFWFGTATTHPYKILSYNNQYTVNGQAFIAKGDQVRLDMEKNIFTKCSPSAWTVTQGAIISRDIDGVFNSNCVHP